MSILHIYDVSEYIYAGAITGLKNSLVKPPSFYAGVRELPDGSYGAASLPTGGLSFMLNPIFEELSRDKDLTDVSLAFCLDSEPDIKRQMYFHLLKDEFGYKGTRGQKPLEVIIQKEAAYDLLKKITPNVFQCKGYEADDIIATLVQQNKKNFDHIYIHALDRDLYSLVSDNVSMDMLGTRGAKVTKDNFSKLVKNSLGLPMIFNGVILDKLEFGDKSDNIPGIGRELFKDIESFIPPDKYSYLTNFRLLRTWVRQATKNPKVLDLLDIIIPLSVPNEDLEIYDEPISVSNLFYIGNNIGNKYCRKVNVDFEGDSSILELLKYYADEYYMRGGGFSG